MWFMCRCVGKRGVAKSELLTKNVQWWGGLPLNHPSRREILLSISNTYIFLIHSQQFCLPLPTIHVHLCRSACASAKVQHRWSQLRFPSIQFSIVYCNYPFFVHLIFVWKYFVWNKFRMGITIRKYFQFKKFEYTCWNTARVYPDLGKVGTDTSSEWDRGTLPPRVLK